MENVEKGCAMDYGRVYIIERLRPNGGAASHPSPSGRGWGGRFKSDPDTPLTRLASLAKSASRSLAGQRERFLELLQINIFEVQRIAVILQLDFGPVAYSGLPGSQ